MKPKLLLSALGALTVLAIASVATLNNLPQPSAVQPVPGSRVFQVHGQVREVDAAQKTIRIAHEEIPGYMAAMIMPFAVRDADLLSGFSPGDDVQFELVVTAGDAWIAHLEKIADAPAAFSAVPASQEREAERVQAGESMPDFALLDQYGKEFHLKDYRGKAVLLTFIYTRCPLPTFCPLMSKNFAELQKRLSKEFPDQYQLLSVSIDPDFDRPAVLKEYAARYGARGEDWTFATGDAAQIGFVAGLMGLHFEREGGLISHDLRTALIGPDGRLVHLWKSNVWTPYEVQRMVRETLTGSRDIAAR